MSYVVMKKGKLNLIARLENETLENQCLRILNELDIELEDYYENPIEQLKGELSDEFYVYNDNLYSLYYKSIDTSYEIAEGDIREDGSIEFLTMYYNGGTCLHEMLDEVMDKINKQED